MQKQNKEVLSQFKESLCCSVTTGNLARHNSTRLCLQHRSTPVTKSQLRYDTNGHQNYLFFFFVFCFCYFSSTQLKQYKFQQGKYDSCKRMLQINIHTLRKEKDRNREARECFFLFFFCEKVSLSRDANRLLCLLICYL